MGAFNIIEAPCICPACQAEAVISAQAHVAASFLGDESGRFSGRTYRLSERMAWWPEMDAKHGAWPEGGDPSQRPLIREACYAKCTRCHAALCAVVEFQDLAAVRLVQVSLEADWPAGYLR
ncbi:hypothetical protein AACH06_23550 [Ideonella sp. DXS29W]|uniref:Uncharacterized protein n=1 Tax=Ideonella lacteola TaxID=2984193 RepID=A0ABU9BY96_9BURK